MVGGATSATRTADQTQIARFWADGAGTYTPPGHWNQIAAQVARSAGQQPGGQRPPVRPAQRGAGRRGHRVLGREVRLRLLAAGHGHPPGRRRRQRRDARPDADWTPLLVTPAFPEYVSGHSTFSGAAEAVLAASFGEHVAFSTGSPRPAGRHARLHQLHPGGRGGRPQPHLRRHPLPVREPGRPGSSGGELGSVVLAALRPTRGHAAAQTW